MSARGERVRAVAVASVALCCALPARATELLLGQPSACAIGDELAFRAERSLGRPLAEAGDLSCTLQIGQDRGALVARLGIASAGQPSRWRSFRAPTCEKLTDTLAVAIVLAVGARAEEAEGFALDGALPHEASAAGAGAGGETQETMQSGGSSAPTASEHSGGEAGIPPDRGVATTDGGAGRGALHGAARAALVIDSGALPVLGVGPALGASIEGDALELRALVTYLPPREASIDLLEGGSAAADVGLVAGALLGCAPRLVELLARDELELGVCGGAELGWLWGNGLGVDAPKDGGALWSALRLDLSSRYPIGSRGLAVELLAGALVPLERHEFRLAAQSLHRPDGIIARVSLGLALELE